MDKKIGFIGAGAMGASMAAAILNAGLFAPEQTMAADIDKDRLRSLEKKLGIQTAPDVRTLFFLCRIVVVAVKPQVLDKVLREIASAKDYEIKDEKIVISIAAGAVLSRIEDILYAPLDDCSRSRLPIVRAMPNTPALVSRGMTGMCANRHASAAHRREVRAILESMGRCAEFDERDMDAVTAVSGSGPAYVFYMADAMIRAGQDIGLDPGAAAELTIQTFRGAAALMAKTGEPPKTLMARVMSPGGTTEAAVKELDRAGVDEKMGRAVRAAFQRSRELANQTTS